MATRNEGPPTAEVWGLIDQAFLANQRLDTVYTAEDDYLKMARRRRDQGEHVNIADMTVIATSCLQGDVDPDTLSLQVKKALRVYVALT